MSALSPLPLCLCLSRIEWVWLHWSEYMKACEEFELWLVKMRRALEPELELQLGVQEKLWQLDHHRVLLSDVHAQSQLLERLLDEAATLHNRTQDPSVDVEAQEGLQEAYNQIREQAQVRAPLPRRRSRARLSVISAGSFLSLPSYAPALFIGAECVFLEKNALKMHLHWIVRKILRFSHYSSIICLFTTPKNPSKKALQFFVKTFCTV